MCVSALSLSLMASCIKKVGNDINVFEKLFFRNIVMVIIVTIGMLKSQSSFLPQSKKSFKSMIYRSLIGLVGAISYFFSLTHLPLAEASLLNKLSPFFIIIFSIIFLKEKLNRAQLLPMALVFVGVLLVIKPTFNNTRTLPLIVGLFSAITSGGGYTMIRYLRNMEHPEIIAFYFALISIITTFPLMIMFGYKLPNFNQMIYLIGTGIFVSIGQLSLSYAYKLAPANEVSIYQYISIIFSTIIGVIVFKEIPDILTFFGGGLVVFSAVWNYKIITKKSLLPKVKIT